MNLVETSRDWRSHFEMQWVPKNHNLVSFWPFCILGVGEHLPETSGVVKAIVFCKSPLNQPCAVCVFFFNSNCWVLWISKRVRQVVSFKHPANTDLTEYSSSRICWHFNPNDGCPGTCQHLRPPNCRICRLMGLKHSTFCYTILFCRYICWRFSLFWLATFLLNPSMHWLLDFHILLRCSCNF